MLRIVLIALIIIATTQKSLAALDDSASELVELLNFNASKEDMLEVHSLANQIALQFPEIQFNLNSLPLNHNKINVIYFSSKQAPHDKTRTYRNNCGYYSELHSIICDEEFITRMIYHYDLHERKSCSELRPDGLCWHKEEIVEEDTPDNILEKRKLLIDWILTHEVGHAKYRHQGNFYFASPSDDYDGETLPRHDIALSQCQKHEIKADAFFSEFVTKSKSASLNRAFFEQLLVLERIRINCPKNISLVLHCEVESGPTIPLPHQPINVTSKRSHPAFLIRLLMSMRAMKVEDGSDELYKHQINKFLRYSIKHSNPEALDSTDCTGPQ